MKRREFITLLGGAASWPLAARAQQTGKVFRIGILSPTPLSTVVGPVEFFRNGLRERGYIEGRNLITEFRSPAASFEQNPELVDDLVRGGVDVILAWTTPAVLAAGRATSTVPIVMVGVGDPLGTGLVAGLARPGGTSPA